MSDQLELFHVDEPERPSRGKVRRWGGNDSRRARDIVRPMLPAPCTRCGKIVTDEMEWHADHLQRAVEGGSDEATNFGPAHAKCNTSDGGKIGAAITNGFKQERDNRSHREVTTKWW
jgi:hypothetical protein